MFTMVSVAKWRCCEASSVEEMTVALTSGWSIHSGTTVRTVIQPLSQPRRARSPIHGRADHPEEHTHREKGQGLQHPAQLPQGEVHHTDDVGLVISQGSWVASAIPRVCIAPFEKMREISWV